MITCRNIVKTFGDLEVLKGVDLDVAPGEVVVIIGPSGSGKSTFLRCMNHLEPINNGTLTINGKTVENKESALNILRQEIGMVFQQFNLFPHMTVMGNIIEAPVLLKKMTKAEALKKGMELLKKVGLEAKADEYPNRLSGGQKQRVAIARALAMEPTILPLTRSLLGKYLL
jgi:ABC-type polar amino acid transport system ATPase subunit